MRQLLHERFIPPNYEKVKPAIQDKIGVHILFTFHEARNIMLRDEMLMKKRVGSSNRFERSRSDPSRRPYNKKQIWSC
jgi:hypothetical protein